MTTQIAAATTTTTTNPALDAAVAAYRARQDRREHPDGSFDKAGRWHPAITEQQSCCSAIRWPSRAWPYSLMLHCRSIGHVAGLYGVDERELRRAARRTH